MKKDPMSDSRRRKFHIWNKDNKDLRSNRIPIGFYEHSYYFAELIYNNQSYKYWKYRLNECPLMKVTNRNGLEFWICNVARIEEFWNRKSRAIFLIFHGESHTQWRRPKEPSSYSKNYIPLMLRRDRINEMEFFWTQNDSIKISKEDRLYWQFPFEDWNPYGQSYELMSNLMHLTDN